MNSLKEKAANSLSKDDGDVPSVSGAIYMNQSRIILDIETSGYSVSQAKS